LRRSVHLPTLPVSIGASWPKSQMLTEDIGCLKNIALSALAGLQLQFSPYCECEQSEEGELLRPDQSPSRCAFAGSSLLTIVYQNFSSGSNLPTVVRDSVLAPNLKEQTCTGTAGSGERSCQRKLTR
jgi:hypothetical protein